MKLAISNIAWEKDEDKQVYQLMRENSITGLEVAPKRVFDDPFHAISSQIEDYKKNLNRWGIKPVAMQALLYGHPELKLFAGEKPRTAMFIHLKECIDFASALGVRVLVFGSPGNRKIKGTGDNKKEEAWNIACSFFSQLAKYARAWNTIICIEPNPPQYGTNFINTTTEGVELVKKVDNPGFRLHLDLGGMILAEENLETALKNSLPYTEHFHISSPYLQMITENRQKNQQLANLLDKYNYSKWLSVEMKKGLKENNIKAVSEALSFITDIYRGK
ncbi:MAG: sugar phosphate isomerase/epimerase family protein [Halanaerobiaceae bacterium]